VVEHLPSKCQGPEFKPQYHQKNLKIKQQGKVKNEKKVKADPRSISFHINTRLYKV
jgi:hypothetical protein